METNNFYAETKQRIKDLELEVRNFEDEIQKCLRGIEANATDMRARMTNKLEALQEIGRLEEELTGKQALC